MVKSRICLATLLFVSTALTATHTSIVGNPAEAKERDEEYESLMKKVDDPKFAAGRRRAVALLNAAGRHQYPGDNEAGWFVLDQLIFNIEYDELEPSNDLPQVNDALLKQTLRFVPEIENVTLQLSHVTAIGLSELEHLKQLRILRLISDDPVAYPSELNDEAMIVVSRLDHLESLTLTGLPITDKGIEQISSLPKLRDLTIIQCRITTNAFLAIAKLPKLDSLYLGSRSRLNDSIPLVDLSKSPTPEVLDAIRRLDGRLKIIEIGGLVHPDIFRTIMPLTSLKEIRISSPDLTVELLDEILPTMRQDLSTLKLPVKPTPAQESRIQELLKRKTTQFPPR